MINWAAKYSDDGLFITATYILDGNLYVAEKVELKFRLQEPVLDKGIITLKETFLTMDRDEGLGFMKALKGMYEKR